MQIVFVSSDMTRKDALTHFASDEQGDWLALAWEDGLSAKLKRRYGVWSMREAQELGMAGRRSGVPAVVVVDPVLPSGVRLAPAGEVQPLAVHAAVQRGAAGGGGATRKTLFL